jgi:hypothetical protein
MGRQWRQGGLKCSGSRADVRKLDRGRGGRGEDVGGDCLRGVGSAPLRRPKRLHDVAAGYNRFDLFDFHVRRERLRPAQFDDVTEESAEVVSLSESRMAG